MRVFRGSWYLDIRPAFAMLSHMDKLYWPPTPPQPEPPESGVVSLFSGVSFTWSDGWPVHELPPALQLVRLFSIELSFFAPQLEQLLWPAGVHPAMPPADKMVEIPTPASNFLIFLVSTRFSIFLILLRGCHDFW